MNSWLDSWTNKRTLPEWQRAQRSRRIGEPGFRSARDMLDAKPQSASALTRPTEPEDAEFDWPWLAGLTRYSRHMSIGCKEFFHWPKPRANGQSEQK